LALLLPTDMKPPKPCFSANLRKTKIQNQQGKCCAAALAEHIAQREQEILGMKR
jgi:hypothetical protein